VGGDATKRARPGKKGGRRVVLGKRDWGGLDSSIAGCIYDRFRGGRKSCEGKSASTVNKKGGACLCPWKGFQLCLGERGRPEFKGGATWPVVVRGKEKRGGEAKMSPLKRRKEGGLSLGGEKGETR